MQMRSFDVENGGTTLEASFESFIVRKVIRKEKAAGGWFDFFWTLVLQILIHLIHVSRDFVTKT